MTDSPAVTFNYAVWVARYPEFSSVSQDLAQSYFDEAGLYCENTTDNRAFCLGILPTLLNMLTAHIAAMNSGINGQPASPIVGRISGATEGSVSVQAEYDSSGSPSEAWYTQTKYGAAYWAATASFRTAIYSAQPTVVFNGAYPGGFGFRRF